MIHFATYKQSLLPPYRKTDAPVIVTTLFLIIGLIFTVTVLNTQTNTQTQAASANSVEPENGTSAGNVTVVNDPNASGGKYVKFGSAGDPTPTPMTDRYGISWGYGVPSPEAMAVMKNELHVQWLRTDCAWSMVQPTGPTSWDWSSCDAIVDGDMAVGIKPWVMLGFTPAWAAVPGCTGTDKCEPANIQDFTNFAQAAAQRYAGRVKAYEIWNEQNDINFWKPAANPTKYTAMLKASYTAIKAADPNVIVTNGGFAAAPNGPSSYSSIEFLKLMYQNGVKGYMDMVAVHPYCYANGFNCPVDEVEWSEWSKMFWVTKARTPGTTICFADPCNIRAVMVAHGDSDKLIVGSEYGYPSAGWPSGTLAGQVDAVANAYQKFKTYKDPVTGKNLTSILFWYNGQDKCSNANDVECNFGLVDSLGNRKPSFSAYQQEALKP